MERYLGGAEQNGDRAALRVEDNGIGLTAAPLADLFKVKRGSSYGTAGEKGSGLCLVLVHDLTKLNGGTVSVE